MKNKVVTILMAGFLTIACGCSSSAKGELPQLTDSNNPKPTEDPLKAAQGNKTEAEKKAIGAPSKDFRVSD